MTNGQIQFFSLGASSRMIFCSFLMMLIYIRWNDVIGVMPGTRSRDVTLRRASWSLLESREMTIPQALLGREAGNK